MSNGYYIILIIVLLGFGIMLPIYCIYLSNNIEPHNEEEELIK
jgi:hypothetical protein